MPGTVTSVENLGQPTIPADADFAICVIGYATKNPLGAGPGPVSAQYSNPVSFASDWGLGDAVDCGLQAIVPTQGNPAPTPISIFQTPATTPGVTGALSTAMTGTAVISIATAAALGTAFPTPVGTFWPKVQFLSTATIGATASGNGQYRSSVDNGATWLPTQILGVGTSISLQIASQPIGVGFNLGTSGSINVGDTFTMAKTTPPMWGDSDLYSAGPPATGALAKIANSSTTFPIVVISEPVAAADFATLTAGLNYFATVGKKAPALLVRFRDPTSGETDAQYIAAFQAFAQSNTDNRITMVAGNGQLTDAFRAFQYPLRCGLPSVVSRINSFAAIPGKLGERMAQHPGFVGRGPLENFSLVDANGNPISQAHDEAVAGGIDGPVAGNGGGLTFYYLRKDTLRGTYVSEAPVLYGALSQILTWMDRRVANGIENIAETLAWTEIQGADVYDPVTLQLDPDIADAIAAKIAKAIRDRYSREFQNAADANLVVINPTVSVTGSQVTISGTVNWRPYGYTNTLALTFNAARP
jgi:hypothetical protein